MKKTILIITSVIFVILMSCRLSTPFSESESETTEEGQFDGISYGDAAVWPSYIPDSIPPIPGVITAVMADSNRVRIFFSDVSQKEMNAYLDKFKKDDFTLKYLLFITDSEQEPSTADIRKGKYDAVDISKAAYAIRIQYGDDGGTMDIDASSFSETVQSGPQWPQDLEGVLPEPNCELEAVFTQTDGTLNIICNSDNTELLQEYTGLLVENGFEIVKESRNQNSAVYAVELMKDAITISLREYQPGNIGIEMQGEYAKTATEQTLIRSRTQNKPTTA